MTSLAFSTDGKLLLTAASDQSANVWKVGGEWEMASTHAAPEPICDADFDAGSGFRFNLILVGTLKAKKQKAVAVMAPAIPVKVVNRVSKK